MFCIVYIFSVIFDVRGGKTKIVGENPKSELIAETDGDFSSGSWGFFEPIGVQGILISLKRKRQTGI